MHVGWAAVAAVGAAPERPLLRTAKTPPPTHAPRWAAFRFWGPLFCDQKDLTNENKYGTMVATYSTSPSVGSRSASLARAVAGYCGAGFQGKTSSQERATPRGDSRGAALLIEWQCSKFPAPFEARVKADSMTPAFRKCGFVVRSMSKPRSAPCCHEVHSFAPQGAKLCRHPGAHHLPCAQPPMDRPRS